MLKKLLFLNLIIIVTIRHSFSQAPVEDKIFTIVEEMPQFPGGDSALKRYIQTNIRYPDKAREHSITGTVYVSFLVDKDGNIQDPKLLRGIGGGCDEEALKVISSMPAWLPGKQNGRAVIVQYNIPIKFNVEKSNTNQLASNNSHFRKFYDQGIKYFEEKEYEKAIESFTSVIANIQDIDSYYNRGTCYKKLGNDTAACNDWRRAKELGDLNVNKLLLKYCGETKSQTQDTVIKQLLKPSQSEIKIKNYPSVLIEEGYEFSEASFSQIKNKNNSNLEILYKKINSLHFDHCRVILDFLMYIDNTGSINKVHLYSTTGLPKLDSMLIDTITTKTITWTPYMFQEKSQNAVFWVSLQFTNPKNIAGGGRKESTFGSVTLINTTHFNYTDYKKNCSDDNFFYEEGLKFYSNNDFKKAIYNFKQALSANENNIDAKYKLSLCYFNIDKKEKGCEEIRYLSDYGYGMAQEKFHEKCSIEK